MYSLKSYFGHSLGAFGSLEAWLGIEMMKDKWFAPTANLVNVDERCAELDYVIGKAEQAAPVLANQHDLLEVKLLYEASQPARMRAITVGVVVDRFVRTSKANQVR